MLLMRYTKPMNEKPLGRIGSVAFDERTPDEEGFAEVFTRSIAPPIRDWNENRILYATLREKRTDKVRIPLMVLAASTGAVTFLTLVFSGLYLGFTLLALGIIAIMLILGWVYAPTYKGAEPPIEQALNDVLNRFGMTLMASEGALNDGTAMSLIWPSGDQTDVAVRFGGKYRDLDIDARWLLRYRSEIDRNGTERREPTFRGWFIRVTPPFDFDGKTVVLGKQGADVERRDKLAKMDGVQLEDAAFAERFAIYATDQVETRVILTPDVMHHLSVRAAELGKVTGDLMLAFDGEYADIALPQLNTSLLSWNPQDMATAADDIHAWFSEIRRTLSFIDDIDVLAEGEGFRGEKARNVRKNG